MFDSEFEESKTSPTLTHHRYPPSWNTISLEDSGRLPMGPASEHRSGGGGLAGSSGDGAALSLSSVSLMGATQEAVRDVTVYLRELHNIPVEGGGGGGGGAAVSFSPPPSLVALHRAYFSEVDEDGFWLEAEAMFFDEATCPLGPVLEWCQQLDRKIELIRRCGSGAACCPPAAAHGASAAAGDPSGGGVSFSGSSVSRMQQGSYGMRRPWGMSGGASLGGGTDSGFSSLRTPTRLAVGGGARGPMNGAGGGPSGGDGAFGTSVPFKSPSPLRRQSSGSPRQQALPGGSGGPYYSSAEESSGGGCGRGGGCDAGGAGALSGNDATNVANGGGSGSPGGSAGGGGHCQNHLRFGCYVDRQAQQPGAPGDAAAGGSTAMCKKRIATNETLESTLAFVVSSAFSCPIAPFRDIFEETLTAAAMNNVVPARILDQVDKHNQTVVVATTSTNATPNAPTAETEGNTSSSSVGVRLPPWRPSAVLLAVSRHVYNSNIGLSFFAPSFPLWSAGPTSGGASEGCLRRALDRLATMCGVFGRNGELPNFLGAMAVFPAFLRAHEATLQFLFFAPDGPLQVADRLMVAVMCAARHRSEYLVRYFAALLSASSSSSTSSASDGVNVVQWLESGPPPKLAALQLLIALAAHKPWSISARHIEALCEEKGWTTQELAHAISIISTVLSLATFCGGLLVSNDVQADCLLPMTLSASLSPARASEQAATGATRASPPSTATATRTVNYTTYTGLDTIQTEARIGKAAKGPDGASISESSFSWANDGAPTLEQLYEGFSGRFSAELSEARNAALSVKHAEGRFCRPGDDPVVAWRALRLYLLNILGVVVDEFNYSQINNRLSFGAKRFAQKSVVSPERVLPSDIFEWKWDAPPAMNSSPSLDSFFASGGGTSCGYHLNSTPAGPGTPVSPFANPQTTGVPSCSFPDQLAVLRHVGVDRAGNTLPELREELLVLAVSIASMMARRETLLTICMSKMTEYFRR